MVLAQGIIVNEISQGRSGAQEYVELGVGERTCIDMCLDLRGWVIDDNTVWFGLVS